MEPAAVSSTHRRVLACDIRDPYGRELHPERVWVRRWQFQHQAGAAQWRVGDVDRSAVALGDAAGEGETESGTAVVAVACLLEAGEALEDAFAIGGGDAGAVVVDRRPASAPR